MMSINQNSFELATLGSGCFWCSEALLAQLKGVCSVVPGYAGGDSPNPTYREVCSGDTGHAEVVQVNFDPQVISYADLLLVFFRIHNPTTLNRQGPDIGTQYRSVIFFHSDEQKRIAQEVKQMMDLQKIWKDRIVTEIAPMGEFFPAEEYHHSYFELNKREPYCQMVIAPKLATFRELFKDSLKG